MMDRSLLNSVGLFMLGLLSTWFWFSKNKAIRDAERTADLLRQEAARIADESKEWQSRVTDLEKQVSLVNQAVVPISTAFQAMLINKLTHFHTPEMDALMVKLGPPHTLTADEEARLAVLLEQRAVDMGDEIPETERVAAKALPLVMILVKHELDSLKDTAELQLVKVPATNANETEAPVDEAGEQP